MKNKQIYKWILLFGVIMSLLIGGIAVKRSTSTNVKENNIIVKENVKIIEDILPSEVRENEVIYYTNPYLEVGDVLVSGIIETAPSGFLRTVSNINVENDIYYITTEDANLLDVFEELHITKSFELTDVGADEILLNVENNQEDLFSYSYIQNNTKIDNVNYQNLNTNMKKQEYQFYNSYNYNLTNGISVEGDFGFNVCLELTLDISGGDIIFGVAAGTNINGKLVTDMQGQVKQKFEKELMSYDLPNLQFQAGPVPIVVTNQINSSIEGEMSAQGDLQTTFEIEGQNVAGFEYNSRNKGVKELNDSNLSTDGIKCTTKEKIAGEVSVGLYVHLVSKLYGSTGFDLSMGCAGDISCEMIVIEDEKSDNQYIGYTDLAIVPKLEGNIIVTVPIIDVDLVEAPIFNVELKPLWEKNWKSSSDWKTLIEENTKIELSNTYRTQYGDVNLITYPYFEVDYPNNWKLTKKEVDGDRESFVLENERGVEIEYNHFSGLGEGFFDGTSGASGVSALRIEVSKVGESSFTPYAVQATDHTSLGEFMVAKLKITGELDMQHDADYSDIDGAIFYAVLPKSRVGTDEMVRHTINGAYAWWYSSHISVIASAPNGEFTEQEEKEIIEILGSFR